MLTYNSDRLIDWILLKHELINWLTDSNFFLHFMATCVLCYMYWFTDRLINQLTQFLIACMLYTHIYFIFWSIDWGNNWFISKLLVYRFIDCYLHCTLWLLTNCSIDYIEWVREWYNYLHIQLISGCFWFSFD